MPPRALKDAASMPWPSGRGGVAHPAAKRIRASYVSAAPGTSAALALAPAQLVHADGVLENAEGDLSPIGEEEFLAGDDLADTFRDEYLAALSLSGDAGG